MEYKNVKFHIKDIDEATGKIAGYTIKFGVLDSYNDITHKGAFRKTLKESGGHVAICKMHSSTLWMGMSDFAEEREDGLFIEATLEINHVQVAREEFSLLLMAAERKSPAGFSIGYETVKHDYETVENVRVRNLRELKWFESSTTPPGFQAVPGAVVTDLKFLTGDNFDPVKAMEWLKQNAAELNELIIHKDLIPDVSSREYIEALTLAGCPTNGAAHSISEPDIHSLVTALDDAIKLQKRM